MIPPGLNAGGECIKCHYRSGDAWYQCHGKCPVVNSPHFDKATLALYKSGGDEETEALRLYMRKAKVALVTLGDEDEMQDFVKNEHSVLHMLINTLDIHRRAHDPCACGATDPDECSCEYGIPL